MIPTTELPNYINGAWSRPQTPEWADVTNPAIGEVLARVPLSGTLQEGDIIIAIVAPTTAAATVESLRAFEQKVRGGGHGQLRLVRDGELFALNF